MVRVPAVAVVIALVNDSRRPLRGMQRLADALQKQVHRDVAPAWDLHAKVVVGQAPRAWVIHFVDALEYPDNAGYHVEENGLPAAYVGVRSADGTKVPREVWCYVASHEMLEMLANPFPGSASSTLNDFPLEIADPAPYAYWVDGVCLSDFALPSWFTGGDAPYDFMGLVQEPHRYGVSEKAPAP